MRNGTSAAGLPGSGGNGSLRHTDVLAGLPSDKVNSARFDVLGVPSRGSRCLVISHYEKRDLFPSFRAPEVEHLRRALGSRTDNRDEVAAPRDPGGGEVRGELVYLTALCVCFKENGTSEQNIHGILLT